MPKIAGKSQRGSAPGGVEYGRVRENCVLAILSRYISETARDRAIDIIERE